MTVTRLVTCPTYSNLDEVSTIPVRWNHQGDGGAHDHVVPHLTIAERSLGSLSAVKTAEQAVQTGLPLSTHIEGVLLIAGTQAPNSWRVLHEFRLRAARSETP
jgi:hypothetical protein